MALVRNNRDHCRYELDTVAGLAVLAYRVENGAMSILHTEVPTALRGEGFGAELVRAALKDARRQNLKIIPSCTYARAFIDRHGEFADLLA